MDSMLLSKFLNSLFFVSRLGDVLQLLSMSGVVANSPVAGEGRVTGIGLLAKTL